jgi:hypothetical protein
MALKGILTYKHHTLVFDCLLSYQLVNTVSLLDATRKSCGKSWNHSLHIGCNVRCDVQNLELG